MRLRYVGLMLLACLGASAQSPPSWPTPTVTKYQDERTQALKLFSPAEVQAADDLFKKAEAAAKLGNRPLAERILRDARWQLPFVPNNLPDHVSRVIGLGRLRHSARVNALSYSPDGNTLASASKDGTVRLWDLGNGREVLVYNGHAEKKTGAEDRNPMWVPNVVFAPNGEVIASAGLKDIHIWEAKTGKLLHKLSGHGPGEIRGLAFAADEKTLVSGGDDGRVLIWDVPAEKPKTVFPQQPNRVEAVAVSVARKQIASVNAVGELHVFSLDGGAKAILAVPITDGGQLGLGVAYAGELGILTCGGDSKAKLTTAPDAAGMPGTTIRGLLGHSDKLNCLASTRDGSLAVTGSKDRTVRVWEVSSGKNLLTFNGHTTDVTAIAIRPDGQQVASGSADGSIRLWPLAKSDENRAATEATAPLWTVATSPDGQLVASAGADRTIRIYDAIRGTVVKSLTGHQSAVTALHFLGKDKLLSTSGDQLVKLWNLTNGQAQDFKGHTSAVLAVAASDAGKLIVTGSVDRSLRGWDETGKALWTWSSPSAICAVSLSKDASKALVGLADGQLILLNVEGAPKVLSSTSAHGNGVAALAWKPDAVQFVSCGGDGYARLWTLSPKNELTPVGKIDPPSRGGAATTWPLSSVIYSPDGKQLLLAGADSLIRIVDAQIGNEVRSLRGHSDWVTALAVAPDGKTIHSVSVDKSLRSFDITPQDRVASSGHSQAVRSIAVHPNGELIATASADGTVKVWNLASGQEIATLTGSGSPLNVVGFVGADQIVAGGEDQRLRWWTWKLNREVRSIPVSGPVFNLATQGDKGTVAAAWVRVNQKQGGFELFPMNADSASAQVTDKGRELTSAFLAADTTMALSGGEDGVIRVWDLIKREQLGADWPVFKGSVADMALTADRKTLIAIDAEGQVKVGQVDKQTLGEPFKAVDAEVLGLIAAPTSDRFITFGKDRQLTLWNLKGEALRRWKLPSLPNTATFTPNGRKLLTGQADGTVFVLQLP